MGEALELVNLTEFARRKADQLSGGQQQRVALARALVLRPRVLLLDEPLGALDAQLRKNLQVELKALQAELGITFVFVTHDQEEALTMSDRIAVMNKGQVEQAASPTRDLRGAARRCSSPTSWACRTCSPPRRSGARARRARSASATACSAAARASSTRAARSR